MGPPAPVPGEQGTPALSGITQQPHPPAAMQPIAPSQALPKETPAAPVPPSTGTGAAPAGGQPPSLPPSLAEPKAVTSATRAAAKGTRTFAALPPPSQTRAQVLQRDKAQQVQPVLRRPAYTASAGAVARVCQPNAHAGAARRHRLDAPRSTSDGDCGRHCGPPQ